MIQGKYVLILENDAYREEIEDLIQEKNEILSKESMM
jgi:hypothetical protein